METRLPCNIDEDCTAVETNIPPKKKKKEEVGSTFKSQYSGKGKPASVVFHDKWGLALKQNGWGKGGKKWPNNWYEREQAYKELMCITGQKLQLQIRQGRAGGAAEPVHVEDDRVENENQDDGARTLNCVMVMVITGGSEGGMEMTTACRTTTTRTRVWRTTGADRRRRRWRRRRRRRTNILFRRTMLMSLIGWISSTGASHPPSPVNPIDTLFG